MNYSSKLTDRHINMMHMTLSDKNTKIIQKLKARFQNLNWFSKLFFPRSAAELLAQVSDDATTPVSLEIGRALFLELAKNPFFRLWAWAWLWLSEFKFQQVKTISNLIVKEQLSDLNDTHIINKMNLLLVCKKPDIKIKVYSVLQSVNLITPFNLDMIHLHPDLPQFLLSLERLQQLHMLSEKNLYSFDNKNTFYHIEDIKLLEDAHIDSTVYREAILLCDSNYSTYLATALTYLHQANKLPLGEHEDESFHTLILFKDIIRYLREFDVIESPDGTSYHYPPSPRPFIMENLSTIVHHTNPDLLSSIFKKLLSITYQTQRGRALFSQERLNTLFNHPDLHALKDALTCMDHAYDKNGHRVRFSYNDFDILLTHSHLLYLIPIMGVLSEDRLLTSENLNKLLTHPQPKNIQLMFNPRRVKRSYTQTMFDTLCNEANAPITEEIPEVMLEAPFALNILEHNLPESISDKTTLKIDNLQEYPELLRFIEATQEDRAILIGSLKQYYRIHLTIVNGYPQSPAFLKKRINCEGGGYHSGNSWMQEDGYIDSVTPMEICVILGLRQAMLALFMGGKGFDCTNARILSWSIASGNLDITKSLLSLPQFMDPLIKYKREVIWGSDRFLINQLFETALEGQHFAVLNTLLQYPHIYKEFSHEKSIEWLLDRAVETNKLSILDYLLGFETIRDKLPQFKNYLYRKLLKIDSVALFARLIETLEIDRLDSDQTLNNIITATQYNSLQIINYILTSPHFSSLEIGTRNLRYLVAICMRSEVSDAVRSRLLQIPAVFSYAEMHEREYSLQTSPFIANHLQALHARKSALETEDTHAVFDVEINEAQLLFYILRNLIRRNSPESHDEIRFLLNIPAVKLLAHTAVTPNEPNELLLFAMTTGNQEAAAILLTIPAVRVLAAEHNFYQNHARGRLNLRAVAQDRESSLRALTTGEQRRLSAAIERYQPVMKSKGVELLFQELTTQLINRYEAHPAQVPTGDGRVIDLPASWEEWCKICSGLCAETQKSGLQAYYKHKDHTALRYLSRPNNWMAPHALYIDQVNRCSTFEEYKPLIIMLYLAAIDKDIAPTDGFTLETRLDHFIDELAHLGRAHNWDHTRIQTNADGSPLLDDNGTILVEEFDDGEGDKPSCYSGVKRRLFQSVLGHPLLKILTLDDIKQEMRDFVREHFKQSINEGNQDMISDAWDNLCETGIYNETTHACLKELNVPLELQKTLVQRLSEKYPTQFNHEPYFKDHIEASFKSTTIFPIHVIRFAAETGFEELIRKKTLIQEAQHPQKIINGEEINRAKTRLTHCETLGDAVIAEIICLQRGRESTWSTIWARSDEKLADILTAVLALPEEVSATQLSVILTNPESDLSKALAIPLLNTLSKSNSGADATILDTIKSTLLDFNQKSLASNCSS